MKASYYKYNDRFLVSVDCVIFGINEGKLSILLAKRRFEPEKGKWSLMGGFVRQDESVEQAAKRVLTELTGMTDVYMEQVGAFGEVGRDPGDRVIGIAYCALLKFDEHDCERVKEHNAQWVSIDKIPPLGFDHPQMIQKAREIMKRKVPYYPIGFNLLPEYFTLTQLQSLYETILEEPIDKRNFRKRIAEMKCVEKTEMIDKSTSKRGALLYRFNADIYNQQLKFRL
jgi:ADP-ribose pyrophosphatase YjhB (NUDIX family)